MARIERLIASTLLWAVGTTARVAAEVHRGMEQAERERPRRDPSRVLA